MYLLKNAHIYSPENLGKKDILIAGGRIEKIADEISLGNYPCETIDLSDKLIIPGLFDQHVHVTGGGGEGSFKTRVPEIRLSQLIQCGITSVVGVLGTDSVTRSVENLIAKVKALKEEGISAYMCTGSYKCPTETLTGDIQKDIVFIEEIIGTKIAISDHRSSNPSQEYFNTVVSNTRTAGMIGGKAGIVVAHMGDDSHGFEKIFNLLSQTSVPVTTIVPTHVSRNEELLQQAFKYAKMGGRIDLTCGEKELSLRAGHVIKRAMEQDVPISNITISSDANGSWSQYDQFGNLVKIGASSASALFSEFKFMVNEEKLPIEQALTFITSNVAKTLHMFPKKGTVTEGCDADLLVLSKELEIESVYASGKRMMENGKVTIKGAFE